MLVVIRLDDNEPEEGIPIVRSRISQAVAGAVLVTVGVAGLSASVSAPAVAAADGSTHATMHRMMAVTHGEDAVERLHQVEGAEQMMEQCGRMMG